MLQNERVSHSIDRPYCWCRGCLCFNFKIIWQHFTGENVIELFICFALSCHDCWRSIDTGYRERWARAHVHGIVHTHTLISPMLCFCSVRFSRPFLRQYAYRLRLCYFLLNEPRTCLFIEQLKNEHCERIKWMSSLNYMTHYDETTLYSYSTELVYKG